MAGPVGSVVELSFPREFPDGCDCARPWAEPERAEAALEVIPPQKPHLGVEVVSDDQALESDAVPVTCVVKLGPVADVIGSKPGRLGLCPVGVDAQVVVKRERPVEPIRFVRSRNLGLRSYAR